MERKAKIALGAAVVFLVAWALSFAWVRGARADTGLAIVCETPDAVGSTVVSRECEAVAQRYDHPQPHELVRTDALAPIGSATDRSRPTFIWTRWDALPVGAPYEVCTNDVPPGTRLQEPGCTDWVFAAKVDAAVGSFMLSWQHPPRFDNGAPLELADIVSTTVEWSDTEPFGEVAGTHVVKGTAASVAMPNPPAGATRCYRVYTTARAPDDFERSGPSSEPWCKVMPRVEVRPMAPTNLQGN